MHAAVCYVIILRLVACHLLSRSSPEDDTAQLQGLRHMSPRVRKHLHLSKFQLGPQRQHMHNHPGVQS